MSVALVLLSAFTHALWNAQLRQEPDKDRSLVGAVAVAALFAIAVALLRWQLTGEPMFATPSALLWSLCAGLLEFVYFTGLAKGLASGSLGVVYTVSRGGAVLVVWPISIALFGEPMTALAATGSAVIIVGLALSSGIIGSRVAGVGWATLCAFAIAGYHLAYKAAAVHGASPSASFAVSMTFASLVNLPRMDRATLRTRWKRIVTMGIVCSGSFLLLIEALASGGAGSALTLRNTSILFAVALAYGIGEKPTRLNVFGAILVAAGAVLIAY